jgi:hypothetical protein
MCSGGSCSLTRVSSDTFLNVGSAEEPVNDGQRLTQHSAFRIQSEADNRDIHLRLIPLVGRNLDDPYEHGNHCGKPGSERTARDTTMEETAS